MPVSTLDSFCDWYRNIPTKGSGNFSSYDISMSKVFPMYSWEKRSFITAAGRPNPWFVFTQFSWNACAVPEYGEPMAEEDALAMDCPEAADPVGI